MFDLEFELGSDPGQGEEFRIGDQALVPGDHHQSPCFGTAVVLVVESVHDGPRDVLEVSIADSHRGVWVSATEHLAHDGGRDLVGRTDGERDVDPEEPDARGVGKTTWIHQTEQDRGHDHEADPEHADSLEAVPKADHRSRGRDLHHATDQGSAALRTASMVVGGGREVVSAATTPPSSGGQRLEAVERDHQGQEQDDCPGDPEGVDHARQDAASWCGVSAFAWGRWLVSPVESYVELVSGFPRPRSTVVREPLR